MDRVVYDQQIGCKHQSIHELWVVYSLLFEWVAVRFNLKVSLSGIEWGRQNVKIRGISGEFGGRR